MPLPTSDFRNPVCLEMKALRNDQGLQGTIMMLNTYEELDIKSKPLANYGNTNKNNNNNGDMGSMDSSDTFASCNTHPFHSQGDLTSDIADPSCAIDSNLYVNPLDKSGDNSPVTPAPPRNTGFKKSASGDTALRSLTTSPMDENYRGFGPIDRGSRVSLNDSTYPKQRRTRFQQVRVQMIYLNSCKLNIFACHCNKYVFVIDILFETEVVNKQQLSAKLIRCLFFNIINIFSFFFYYLKKILFYSVFI